MSDIVDSMTGAYIGASLANSDQQQAMQAMALKQRAQNISDTFGAKPLGFEEYRKESGNTTRIGKALLYAAVGAAAIAGGGILLFAAEGAGLALAAVLGATMGGSLSVSNDRKHAVNDYETYMSDFAGKARAAQEQRMAERVASASQQPQQAAAKQWTADIDAQRTQQQQAAAPGK